VRRWLVFGFRIVIAALVTLFADDVVGVLTLTLTPTPTAKVNANVTPATHGENVDENQLGPGHSDGCSFPVERCLCECSAPGSCTYWAYFARNPDGSWAYSPNGASARAVSDGDMDAWVWLSGSGPSGPATPPVPETSFEAICR